MTTRRDGASLLDAYFHALAAHDPWTLPLADVVRFTENGQRLGVGSGLWASVTAVAPERAVTVVDADAGQAAAWGMIAEGGAEALLGVRLKVHEDKVTEIETLVARRPMFGRSEFPAVLHAPSLLLAAPVADHERSSRADLVAAANAYFDGVAGDDAQRIPVDDDCVRLENGLQTTRNAEGVGVPPGFALSDGLGLGVREQIRRADFRYIEAIRDRRFDVVDDARGLVLAMCFFDHPGQLRRSDYTSPIVSPNSMMVWEVFKVVAGRIDRIEAIIAAFPYGMRSGW